MGVNKVLMPGIAEWQRVALGKQNHPIANTYTRNVERLIMITRIWEGRTRIEHSEVYTKIIEERDIPDYKKTAGFVKLTFLKNSDSQFTYFKLLTFWTDLDVVKNFTGPEFDQAKSHDEDEQYLLDFPGSVSHYKVFAE